MVPGAYVIIQCTWAALLIADCMLVLWDCYHCLLMQQRPAASNPQSLLHSGFWTLKSQYYPRWKGPRTHTNKNAVYRSRVTVRYHLVPPQTVHFRFDRKLENQGVASTLCGFEPSAPRLLCPGSRSATNLVHSRNAIISFFLHSITLIVTGAIER